MKAWHFVGDRLRDGRPIPPDGVTLVHDGPVVPCKSGLHASYQPFDALQYVTGATLCLVECDGTIVEHGDPIDKITCSERTIIVRMDATPLLRWYACQQALKTVHLWDPPQVVLDYLMTGDERIRRAAWTATHDVAWTAARNVAWTATHDVAWTAARNAAWTAAHAAALVAAKDAARDEFNQLVYDTFEDWL